jgi:hypothetical protein
VDRVLRSAEVSFAEIVADRLRAPVFRRFV